MALFANKLPQHAVLPAPGAVASAGKAANRARSVVKLAAPGWRSDAASGGHGVQHGAPQADLVGVGRVQQQVSAGLEGLDVAGPRPRRHGPTSPSVNAAPWPRKQAVPHQAAGQADVPGGQAASAVARGGVLLPQTRVQAQGGVDRAGCSVRAGFRACSPSMMTTPSRAVDASGCRWAAEL